jgi:hypothetical protein
MLFKRFIFGGMMMSTIDPLALPILIGSAVVAAIASLTSTLIIFAKKRKSELKKNK